MEKKNIEWSNLGFGYMPTDYRYVSNFKDGKWDDGALITDPNVTINECAGVLQYAQTVFEGLKAYTTEDGKIVCFRPDLNAERLKQSAERLEIPPFPEDRFIKAVEEVVKANAAWVPPYGSGATLYIRPYIFGSNAVIGVKPADEYQFRILCTPVGPYFKGGAKPITIRVCDYDRAAPHGTGNIKAGLNYAMSLYAIVDAHKQGYDENMYLDAATRTYVEETGGANFLFVTKDGTVVTPNPIQFFPPSQGVRFALLPKKFSGSRLSTERLLLKKLKTLRNAAFAAPLQLSAPLAKLLTTARKSASLQAWKKWAPLPKNFMKPSPVFKWAKSKAPKAGFTKSQQTDLNKPQKSNAKNYPPETFRVDFCVFCRI